jgi:NO-binding membrane sensor protein with MHYT domain
MQHTGVYDPTLVALSVLIAVFASYTALDLATRIRASLGWSRFIWLASAAAAMGGGIWSCADARFPGAADRGDGIRLLRRQPP